MEEVIQFNNLEYNYSFKSLLNKKKKILFKSSDM